MPPCWLAEQALFSHASVTTCRDCAKRHTVQVPVGIAQHGALCNDRGDRAHAERWDSRSLKTHNKDVLAHNITTSKQSCRVYGETIDGRCVYTVCRGRTHSSRVHIFTTLDDIICVSNTCAYTYISYKYKSFGDCNQRRSSIHSLHVHNICRCCCDRMVGPGRSVVRSLFIYFNFKTHTHFDLCACLDRYL